MTSGSQAELDYGRKERVARRLRLSLRAVKDAVDSIGLNVAAAACGCTTSELCGAMKGRKHRPFRLEWLIAICDVAPPDFRAQILETLLASRSRRRRTCLRRSVLLGSSCGSRLASARRAPSSWRKPPMTLLLQRSVGDARGEQDQEHGSLHSSTVTAKRNHV